MDSNRITANPDKTIIHGNDQAEHDARLLKALTRISTAGVTLHPDKCEITWSKFLGHIVDSNGITANPDNMKALEQMEKAITVTKLYGNS